MPSRYAYWTILVDDQPEALGIYVVTKNWMTTCPFAFSASGADLVAGTFADDFSLKLGETQEYVHHEPAHGGAGVNLLRHAYEGAVAPLEDLHHPGEVEKGPG